MPTRYVPLTGTANALKKTEAEVLEMEANGEITFQMNGNVKEYVLDFDSKRTPRYTPKKP